MKQDPFFGVYRALTPKELAEMFMNPHAPKTEAEHWAVREIEKLTRELDEARAEVERLTGKLKLVADALNDTISKYHEVGDQNDRLDAENERLREALHRVSLASQNSMSSKDECGRIARETLEVKS